MFRFWCDELYETMSRANSACIATVCSSRDRVFEQKIVGFFFSETIILWGSEAGEL